MAGNGVGLDFRWRERKAVEIVDLLPDWPSFEDEYRRLSASESRYESQIGHMMIDFIHRLRRGIIGPRLSASTMLDELCLQYRHRHRSTMITAKIDHKDRSTLVDGLPVFHYRLTYSVPSDDSGVCRNIELRTRNLDQAYEFVVEAIKTCQQRD